MTAPYPPVVRSRTGRRVHHPDCATIRPRTRRPRPPVRVTPGAAMWTALALWWGHRYAPDGRWTTPPAPWASCCAHRVAAAAGWHTTPTPAGDDDLDAADDAYLGGVTVALCARAAEAWAAGREDAAHRWFDVAARIPGRFSDGAAPYDHGGRP